MIVARKFDYDNSFSSRPLTFAGIYSPIKELYKISGNKRWGDLLEIIERGVEKVVDRARRGERNN